MFLRKENIPDDFPDVPLLIELSTGSWNVNHVNDVNNENVNSCKQSIFVALENCDLRVTCATASILHVPRLALVGCPVKRAGLLQVVPCNT